MKFQLGTPVAVVDIAAALDQEFGTYIATINGQNFLAVSEEGHSLTVFRPFGPMINVTPSPLSGQTLCWLTKISSKNIGAEYSSVTTGEFGRRTATG